MNTHLRPEAKERFKEIATMPHITNVMICTCTNCISNGALDIRDSLEAEIKKKELQRYHQAQKKKWDNWIEAVSR